MSSEDNKQNIKKTKIHAYQEIYLNKVQSMLGVAFDYAINACTIPGEEFIKQFIASSVSIKLENGEPEYIAGKSGIELAVDIVFETTGETIENEFINNYSFSPEYWIGWAVAYYQWWSSQKYSTIFNVFSFNDLKKIYYTLHEADISKFVDIADRRIKEFYPETNLKRFRSVYGYSQAELSKKSGVSLKSIQMYEQRNKDINKASVETIFRIAKTLGCSVEDLIEK